MENTSFCESPSYLTNHQCIFPSLSWVEEPLGGVESLLFYALKVVTVHFFFNIWERSISIATDKKTSNKEIFLAFNL